MESLEISGWSLLMVEALAGGTDREGTDTDGAVESDDICTVRLDSDSVETLDGGGGLGGRLVPGGGGGPEGGPGGPVPLPLALPLPRPVIFSDFYKLEDIRRT